MSASGEKRPGSASSRSAWNDDGLDAPGRPVSGSSDASSTDKRVAKSATPTKAEKKVKTKKKENVCSRIVNSESKFIHVVPNTVFDLLQSAIK